MAETPEKTLAALELRAQLLAAERACEELGARLSVCIREFSADELLAYARETDGGTE